jgi:hypothetical protein
LLVAAVDHIVPFGGAPVTLTTFSSQATGTERDFVCADELPAGEEFEDMIFLEDQDRIGVGRCV